ncbi:MAG: NAD(P)-dependent oxidoreductase [Promethearchaeota archaeon]|jgi:phosphoglycerate dehydrogenase-like enzyme
MGNVNLIFKTKSSEKKVLEDVSRADILIGWRPSKELLSNARKARLFINPGAGIQPLIELFREVNEERAILLINGHGNSYFVAQHAVALLLTLMNKIIPHDEWMRKGGWRTGDQDAISIPLRFRKVGFLGYGAINQKIHRFLSGFEIEFSILRKHWEKQISSLPTEASKYEFTQLHEFLKEIDILIIGVPLTSMTRQLIKKKELELLGKDGLIINIARGIIIDEESLYVCLKDKVISGAAIDVWYDYTPKSDGEGKKFPFHFPFNSLDNIILSPHRGYSPFSDLLRWDEVIENIKRMANGRNDFINVVDLNEEY